MTAFTTAFSPAFAGGAFTNFTLDSVNDWIAWRFRMADATAIAKAEFRIQAITDGGDLGNLESVLVANSAGHPNGNTDIGSTLVSTAKGSLTAGQINKVTFGSTHTPSAGDFVWLVLYPHQSVGTFDASNKYVISYTNSAIGVGYGDNRWASSTDGGSTWTEQTSGFGLASLLDGSDNFLPQSGQVAAENISTVDFNNTDTPDEYASGFDLDAGMTIQIHGAYTLWRLASSAADFKLIVYKDGVSVASRTFDTSVYDDQFTVVRSPYLTLDSPIEISGAARVQVAIQPISATDMRTVVFDFGTQIRRESMVRFRDMWLETQTNEGGFTADKTQMSIVFPVVEIIASAGGGPAARNIRIN